MAAGSRLASAPASSAGELREQADAALALLERGLGDYGVRPATAEAIPRLGGDE